MNTIDVSSQRHSYWMQSIYNNIRQLKLHELALPSAHNSGMDRGVAEHIGGNFAVCQDYSFATLLARGARVLDLRVFDESYKKDVGGSKIPRYKFQEEIVCKHFLRGRNINNCISEVRSFAEARPGEIIILDVRSYNPGRNLNNAPARFKAKLNTLAHLLIPAAANSLSLEKIRQTYPGRNVIIGWSQGGYWPNIPHNWSGKDLTSVSQLLEYIKTFRNAPPAQTLTSLSATAYTVPNGPWRIQYGNAVWNEVFSAQQRSFNIINADFIQDTGIVERCIALNIARGATKP